jgi:hypothetical protein
MAKPSKYMRTIYAQEQNEEDLLARPGVLGVATGYRMRAGEVTDEVCVQVYVERKLAPERLEPRELLPGRLPGFEGEQVRTDVIEITPPVAEQDTTRYRPVPGGCSIGPESRISAGTLGGYACDNTDNSAVLVSNNHVISNLDTMPAARRITQPGRFDGGTLPDDVIGELKRDVTLSTIANPPPPGAVPPVSAVDAAIGTIDVARTNNVLQIGDAIYEVQAPVVGQAVQKRGRRTGLTNNATVFSVNGTFNIRYQNSTRLGRIANTFVNRSTDGNLFNNAGDSGSLIFNQQRGQLNGTFPVLGLHYAGGAFNDGTPAGFACDINAVFGALNLTTICTCVVRALIRAVFDRELHVGRDEARLIARKERQLRALREQVRQSRMGKQLDDFVTVEAGRLTEAVLGDPKAFGLAVRALEPLLRQRTVLDMMEMEIDPRTAETVTQLTALVGRRSRDRELRSRLDAIGSAVGGASGSPLGKLLRRR